jgi:glutamine amidotransferase
MIAIIDYNMGNLRSVNKAFKRIGIDAVVTSNITKLRSADRLVLPGVGHFERGMKELKDRGLLDLINEQVFEKSKPILGICLGMQLMTQSSEEGNVNGLQLINAETIKFDLSDQGLKVPHIGWNTISANPNSKLLEGLSSEAFYYFVHSYYVRSQDVKLTCSITNYGHDVVSCFEKDNVFGVQFHPEKSHRQGLDLLKNFATLNV